MDRDVVERLVYSMVQFLGSQLESEGRQGNLTDEGVESVEVAIQCLETAYGISQDSSHLGVSRSLYDIFSSTVGDEIQKSKSESSSAARPLSATPVASAEDKAEANQLKDEGNQLMREDKFKEAIECYTKAINKDCSNAVYFCNRAAAHSKLADHRQAISDCQQALQIEPNYSKAYGRMGLAYSSLNEHKKAKECYEKALQIEPENESYRSNLNIAEEKLKAAPQPQPGNPFAGLGGMPLGGLGGLAGLGGGAGGPDLGNLLSNPALMNMATQLMADPNMQNMMSNFLGSISSGGANPNGGQQGDSVGMEALLTAGRQLAEQMQAQNPELVNQLRQMNRRPDGAPDGGSQDPPPQN